MVATLAVIIMTSVVRAEELVDFDGGSKQMVSLEGLKRTMTAFETPLPAPATTSPMPDTDKAIYKLGKIPRRALIKFALREGLELDSNIIPLINNETADIMYNDQRVCFIKTDNGDRYMTLLENRDVRFITLIQHLAAQTVPATKWNPEEPGGMCKDYITKDVCVSKQLCHVVSAGGGAAIGGVPGAIAGEIAAQTICEWVPACTPVQVCIAWY